MFFLISYLSPLTRTNFRMAGSRKKSWALPAVRFKPRTDRSEAHMLLKYEAEMVYVEMLDFTMVKCKILPDELG